MNSEIDISVIVPVYNKEKYIQKNIESILAQTKESIEIILIDDGSTDRSSEICTYFSDNFNNVVYKKINNSGVSCARNEGIKVALGEYCIFIDADDYVEKNMLDNMYSFIQNKGCDLVICGMNEIIDGRVFKVSNESVNEAGFISLHDIFKLNLKVLHSSGNKLFKTAVIIENDIGFLEGIHSSEDINFVLKYLYYSVSAYFVDECLYNYVRNEDSVSMSSSINLSINEVHKQILDNMSAYLDVGDFLENKNESRKIFEYLGYYQKLKQETIKTLVAYQNAYVKDSNASIIYFVKSFFNIEIGKLSYSEKTYVYTRMMVVVVFSGLIRLIYKVRL